MATILAMSNVDADEQSDTEESSSRCRRAMSTSERLSLKALLRRFQKFLCVAVFFACTYRNVHERVDGPESRDPN